MPNSLITKKYSAKNHGEQHQKPLLVLIHGWGLNSAVWKPCIETLQKNVDIITVDLPGFGANLANEIRDYSLSNIVNEIQLAIDKPAVYVGWSLGGLVATQLAKTFPKKVLGCITVASSPCFLHKENWPGIMPSVLKMFHKQLAQNTEKTLEGFLKLQAMGSPHVRQDIKTIRDLVMQYPVPTEKTLNDSLLLLEIVDLRAVLPSLKLPFLRLYGKLDGLVPKAIIEQVDDLLPQSQKYVFDKASHAPFISHADEFNEVVLSWVNKHISA